MPSPTLFGTSVVDWDTIAIGAWTFANTKITISGELSIKLDVKPAPGTDGARETYLGYQPAKVEIAIVLHNEALWASWAGLVGQIKPKPGKTAPAPISVSHPMLRVHGLSAFYLLSMPLPRPVGPQQYEGHILLVEYFSKPKPQGTQPTTSLSALPSIFDGSNRATPSDPQNDNVGP